MPNIKSQKDRVVQAKKEAMHNKAIKSNLKTVVKKADAAISAGAADKDEKLKAAVVAIDKAAAKGAQYGYKEMERYPLFHSIHLWRTVKSGRFLHYTLK